MAETTDVKFSVSAMVDLLGFSSHLEISSYDLRTSIGRQAVSRLEFLDKTIELMVLEKKKRPEYYPDNFHMQRWNDAVFLTLDLDDILIPSVGDTKFKGLSANDIYSFFDEEQLKDKEAFLRSYDSRILNATENLAKFLGIISRMHMQVNKLESSGYFPGAKTVVSTGFRRPFVSKTTQTEDHFSANFAMANVYVAEESLSGPNLFVENSILQMISHDQFGRKLLKFAHFVFKETVFDCFGDSKDVFTSASDAHVPEPIEIGLFRKQYLFRRLNPSPLSFLQIVPIIRPFLNGDKKANLDNIYYRHLFHAIKLGFQNKQTKGIRPPASFIYNRRNDLDKDIGVFNEFLTTGKSETQETEKRRRLLAQYSLEDVPEDDERRKKIMALLEQEVEVDFIPIQIEDLKDSVFQLDGEVLTALMPILKGNIDQLDYGDERTAGE